MSSLGISKIFQAALSKKSKLREIDVRGNFVDVGILHPLRKLLEGKSKIKRLGISGIHKFNEEITSKIIQSFGQSKLKWLGIGDTTEAFYYGLRQAFDEQNKNIKISFTRFVKEVEKDDKDQDENVNTENIRDKVNDYAEKVRQINKQKFNKPKRKENKEDLLNKQIRRNNDKKISFTHEIINLQPRYNADESEISELTNNLMTSYQKEKRRNTDTVSFYRKTIELEEDKNNDQSLQYSFTSSESESNSGSSVYSDFYSTKKLAITQKLKKLEPSIDTDLASFQRQIEDAT
jgi:hypothetical protein